jgi:2-amino-4-hydroxy-6-hydroxymethyldihydropteridine diphosphokinase
MRAVIAIGANIGDPQSTVQAAIKLLSEELTDFKASSLYLTKPVGYLDQPDFVNAVVIGDTDLKPEELLEHLHQIENNFGRTREIKWGPRTLDLDLIECGVAINSPTITLPHPRAFQRKFVLEPWLEIDPNGVLTGVGAIKALLEQLENS